MTRSRSFSRGPASYKRGKPRIPSSGKAFLIVTEGKKTEPNYFFNLRNRLQLSVADVVIHHPAGTDPITLTDRAIELRENRKREAKNSPAIIAYDEVWVVFDLEKPHDQRRDLARRAFDMCRTAGIKYATSDPCFEFWLLLHLDYTTRPFHSCDELIEWLQQCYWEGYEKNQMPSAELIDRVPIAVENAQRCRAHHESSGGCGNPSTEVDKLVRSLNLATRPHFQFQLPV